MGRPSFHHLAALLEQVPAPVRRLDLVLDGVGERRLLDLVREAHGLLGPVAEGRAEVCFPVAIDLLDFVETTGGCSYLS